jgi:chaperonin GroES
MKKEAKDTKNTKNNIRPLGDRVLVRRQDVTDTKSPSGIIIPDTAKKEKSKIGVVVAVGEGRVSDEGTLVPMSLKVGAKVIFNSGWDNEVDMGDKDEEFFLVKESDILAIIK